MKVNGIKWDIAFVSPTSDHLMMPTGEYTVGVTDNDTKTIYLSNMLDGAFLKRVLTHELVHCASFSYKCTIDPGTEEVIADFMSLYGAEIIWRVDDIFTSFLKIKKSV